VTFAAAAASSPVPRIPPALESSVAADDRQIITEYGQDGRAANDLLTYLNHPGLAKDVMPFERYVASQSTLPARHRELLILRTAALSDSAYVWAHHVPLARTAGLT